MEPGTVTTQTHSTHGQVSKAHQAVADFVGERPVRFGEPTETQQKPKSPNKNPIKISHRLASRTVQLQPPQSPTPISTRRRRRRLPAGESIPLRHAAGKVPDVAAGAVRIRRSRPPAILSSPAAHTPRPPGLVRAGSRVARGGVLEATAAMDAADDDARTFKADFTDAGEELLRGRLRDKLLELNNSADVSLLVRRLDFLSFGYRGLASFAFHWLVDLGVVSL